VFPRSLIQAVSGAFIELFRGLREQRARTVTTLLGISWGAFAVVTLLAFGTGLQRDMERKAANLGRGIGIVSGRQTTRPFGGLPAGREIDFRIQDIVDLPRQIPEMELVSPEYILRDRMQVRERIHRVTLSGIYPSYGKLRAWIPRPGGRFINDRDIEERRRVVVLGDRVKEFLFRDEPAVGRTVLLRGRPFRVVGVLTPKEQDSSYSSLDRDRVCLPATTHEQLYGQHRLSYFIYRARSPEAHGRATDRIYEVLGRRYRFDPSDRQALSIWDTTEEEHMRRYIFLGFHLMLAGSGALTLLVGGVGVGNLLYIRVRQRTREIGIQMALGARPRRILLGVLGESLLLVALGGTAGFSLAWLLAAAAGRTPLAEQIGTPEISPAAAAGTVLLLAAVGLLAGYFPARRAARLDPVRALAE